MNSVVYSTGFKLSIEGDLDPKVYYMRDVNDISDPTTGKMILFYLNEFNEEIVVNKDFGTVDYDKGEVLIGYQKPIKIYDTELDDYVVEVRAYPKDVDVVAKQFMYINLDVSKSIVSAVEETGGN